MQYSGRLLHPTIAVKQSGNSNTIIAKHAGPLTMPKMTYPDTTAPPTRCARCFKAVRTYMIPALIAIVIALFVRAFLLQSYVVVSGSMLPTLPIGQRVVAQRVMIDPQPGSIVVFTPVDSDSASRGLATVLDIMKDPFGTNVDDSVLIKRVIATGGQSVQAQDGKLFVDGQQVDDSHAANTTYDFGPILVPRDHVFVMGDNRRDSLDSRIFGPVPLSHVVAIMWFEY